MHEHLARTLHFPSYYGKNLNAFNDCLGDMQDIDSVGQVLVLRRFDRPVSKFKDHCEGLLDIIAHQSRIWLVEGQRLLCLVQSDDPDLDFGIVGGYRPSWNRSEWSDSERKAPRIES